VKNEEVSHCLKEDRSGLHKTKHRKAKWICQILRRNCLLKHVIEEETERDRKIEVTTRRIQLLGDL
jgi:hypothetical protein